VDHDTVLGTVKAVPPAAFLTAQYFGLTMPEIITICTTVYTVGLAIQTLWKGYKFLREHNFFRGA
jgi:hypothetical protein